MKDAYLSSATNFIKKNQQAAGIPGMAVVIVRNGETHQILSGYTDCSRKNNVTADTLFELGSVSKAFTCLGALVMAKQGILNLESSVDDYLPWFEAFYQDKKHHVKREAKINIRNLIYHTSGIREQSLLRLRRNEKETALLGTAQQINGMLLSFQPGTQYEYASNNTNLLACVMETAAKMPFHQYMKENLLIPLGLRNTYLYRSETDEALISTGFKYMFLKPRKHKSPVLNGNAPAGHMLSCATDMQRWIKLQLGQIEVDPLYREAIEESHKPQFNLPKVDGYHIAAGWDVHENGQLIKFTGRDPNYATMLLFDMQIGCGTCVLSNLATSMAYYIGENIFKVQKPSFIKPYAKDNFQQVDSLFSWISGLSAIFLVLLIILGYSTNIQLLQINLALRIGLFVLTVAVEVFLLYIPNLILKYYNSFCIDYFKSIIFQVKGWISPSFYLAAAINIVNLTALFKLFFI